MGGWKDLARAEGLVLSLPLGPALGLRLPVATACAFGLTCALTLAPALCALTLAPALYALTLAPALYALTLAPGTIRHDPPSQYCTNETLA